MIVGEVRSEESALIGMMDSATREIKVFTKNFPDGELKEEYQYYHHPENHKRMKEGSYNSYYPDGKYMEVGRYKENKRKTKETSKKTKSKEDGSSKIHLQLILVSWS